MFMDFNVNSRFLLIVGEYGKFFATIVNDLDYRQCSDRFVELSQRTTKQNVVVMYDYDPAACEVLNKMQCLAHVVMFVIKHVKTNQMHLLCTI